tara:strand:+ start:67173 stop:69479 length:2307 start_codon:yes stop_codon:yes gene_type:complete
MAGYDFSALSPHEFEELTRDLLEKKHGVPFQAFTVGPDGGIDLRHSSDSNKQWVVQCKHFAKSQYSSLKSHIKKELRKIQKLNPKRYILVTSLGLTPKNVDELFDLLQPYCVSKHDIIGKDDLNGILRDNPEIENSHFKLWITSERVLSRVLHNDVMVQSSMTKEEIHKRLGLYVFTDMFKIAKNKLESDGVCIISGIPGVGKTTLAEMLLVDHLMKDWQLVTIHQNISEALQVLREDPKAKQIFYYDDFLGQIKSGEKLAKNEDRTLLQLIKSVSTTKTKRFILTTREYILSQAKEEHEQLARSDIEIYKFVIECEDYNDESKAKILANHLYYFGVQQKYIAAIIKNEKYRNIINHQNYSPRIIESMTCRYDFSTCSPSQYPEMFISNLDNPSEIWLNAYSHLSEAARHLLLSFVSCGGAVFTKDLKRIFEAFWVHRSKIYGLQRRPDDFLRSLRELEGNFILIHKSGENRIAEPHNPSVLDFIENHLQEESDTIEHLVKSALCFDQIMCLSSTLDILKYIDNISDTPKQTIGEAIARTFWSENMTASKSGLNPTKWEKNDTNKWKRIRVCIKVADEINNIHLRNVVEDITTECFAQITNSHGYFDEYIIVLELLSSSKWVSEATKSKVIDITKTELQSDESLDYQSLEDLSFALDWASHNRNRFSDQEYKECLTLFSKEIRSKVDDLRSESDRTTLETSLSTLEEIESYVDLDLSLEKISLDEAISECPNYDSDEIEGNSSPSPPTSSVGACDPEIIKSIFDSLIR